MLAHNLTAIRRGTSILLLLVGGNGRLRGLVVILFNLGSSEGVISFLEGNRRGSNVINLRFSEVLSFSLEGFDLG